MQKRTKGRRIARDSRPRRALPVVLSLLGALVCLCGVLWEQLPYWQAARLYETIGQPQHTAPPVQTPAPDPVPPPTPPPEEPLHWDAQMAEALPGMVAWLRCEGTALDYPVMQGEDNEFYLDHLADGRANRLGAIFLDFQADSDFSAPVSVIYGHSTRNGTMFGGLRQYENQAYYDEHPALELYTPQGDYQIQLLAAYLVDGTTGSYPSGFPCPEERDAYLQEAAGQSFFQSAYPLTGDTEPLIILSTCSYDFPNARLALVGRLSPVPESVAGVEPNMKK